MLRYTPVFPTKKPRNFALQDREYNQFDIKTLLQIWYDKNVFHLWVLMLHNRLIYDNIVTVHNSDKQAPQMRVLPVACCEPAEDQNKPP